MQRRQPLPRLWMVTDERQGERLWSALERLPVRAGVIFRHHRLDPIERRALFDRIRKIARRRRLLLLVAGPPALARAWRADGSHGRGPADRRRWRSAPAHDLAEIRAAERAGADVILLSPAFATQSHPDATPLGAIRFGLLARQARLPILALGGMSTRNARHLRRFGIHGWAAIDAWTKD
ncbi:MAG TPA: thiamine phosphate synthase [Allosphingosinicella sp.]|nr:thiamine phosphate synthase [Allosphingosinicella sp.]